MNGSVTKCDLFQIQRFYEDLADQLVPHISVLTQSVSLNDQTLFEISPNNTSTDRYEAIYDYATKSRLNKTQKLSSIDEYIKPLSQKLKMAAKI